MMKARFASLFVVTALTICSSVANAAPAGMVDTVVASVNGKPITWSDVQQRIGPSFAGSLDDASSDPRVREAVDTLILEQLVREDADAKRLSASNEEITAYIGEIAQRNGLSVDGFRAALEHEGKSFSEYEQQVRLEILKGKLASAYLRGGIAVSDEEVDSYIKDHPELTQRGSKVELAQIFVSTADRTAAEAHEIISKASEALAEGKDFSAVAAEFSEGDEKANGGSLGILNERELSQEIFNAILLLKPGQVSDIVLTNRGLHLFKVVSRSTDEVLSEALRTEVRKQLQASKVDEKLNSFFTTELFKNYAVDKKI